MCVQSVGVGRSGEKEVAHLAVHHPGIEPRASRWQRDILPLNQWCRISCAVSSGAAIIIPARSILPHTQ